MPSQCFNKVASPAKAGIQLGDLRNWTSTGLNMPRMFKDRPGDDPTRRSFAGEEASKDEIACFQFGRQRTGQSARHDRTYTRRSRLKLPLKPSPITAPGDHRHPRPTQNRSLLAKAGRDQDRHMPYATWRVLERFRLR
jgi:hypothetical protein